jgi:hypothetical protein
MRGSPRRLSKALSARLVAPGRRRAARNRNRYTHQVVCTRRRSATGRALLSVRPLPVDLLLASRRPASQSTRTVEPGSGAGMGQQMDHQHQSANELLVGRERRPLGGGRAALGPRAGPAGHRRRDCAHRLPCSRPGVASQYRPVARHGAGGRELGYVARGRGVACQSDVVGDTFEERTRSAFDSEDSFFYSVAGGQADLYTFNTLEEAARFAKGKIEALTALERSINTNRQTRLDH